MASSRGKFRGAFHGVLKIATTTVVTLLATSNHAAADNLRAWTGPYIGAGIGALALGGTETDRHTAPAGNVKFDGGPDWGPLATLTAGYNYQVSHDIVIGAFADIDFTSAKFSVHSPDGDTNRLREHRAYSFGARLGYLASHSTLLYVDGGYTRGDFKFNYSDEYSRSKSFDGWFAGGGVEQKISGPWSASVGYRYSQFGKEQVGEGTPPPPPAVQDHVTHSTDATSQSIRLGLKYSFGSGQ